MAILYKPHGNEAGVTGGIIQFGGASGGTNFHGHAGPFPRYSISRDEVRTGDGTPLVSKFTINVDGVATIHEDDTQDITDKGLRQQRIQGQAINNLQLGRAQQYLYSVGRLDVEPYGGKTNKITFTDAKLISIECVEQSDESSGIQTLEYSVVFEAYQEASATSNNSTALGARANPLLLMSSVEETWDVAPSQEITVSSNDLTESAFRTFTIKHTVTGTGIKKFTSSSTGDLDDDGDAWRQCVKWVKSRLTDDPLSVTSPVSQSNIVGSEDKFKETWSPRYMGKEQADLGFDFDPSAYTAYNSVRTVNSSYGEGTYSVTTTWLVSENTTLATHDVGVSINVSDNDVTTVVVNGTISGLSSMAPGNPTATDDKFTNASEALETALTKTYELANTAYGAASIGGTLRNTVLSKSIGENKGRGSITYNVAYDDADVDVLGALSQSLDINYDNEDGLNEVIAIIPIIGKSNGPVIQDMGTTTQKSVQVNLELVMDKSNRTAKPDGTTIATTYKPSSSYQQSKTESWSPRDGSYSLQINWVYV